MIEFRISYHLGRLVLEQVHSNTSQRANSPFGVFTFITLVNVGEELADECRVSILDDGLPCGSHKIQEIVDIMDRQTRRWKRGG